MLNQSSQQTDVTQKLSSLRQQIHHLKIPSSTFAVIWTNTDKMHITELGGEAITHHEHVKKNENLSTFIDTWLKDRAEKHNLKFVAAQVIGDEKLHPMISNLWLKEDIVPLFTQPSKIKGSPHKEEHVQELADMFDEFDIAKIKLINGSEVEVSELVTLEDYKKVTPKGEWKQLLKLAKQFKGKKLVFINATPQGGGVALMRHALIRLYRLLGVNASWHILEPRKEVFDITKTKFHNVLQAVVDESVKLSSTGKKTYKAWHTENILTLKPVIEGADVIVIDDPQPAGLIPHIRDINKNAFVIYRSHIQIVSELADKKGTSQYRTWSFIWDFIKSSDLFVCHPMKEFVPEAMPPEKTVFMPATTDPLDGLNKSLSKRQTEYYMKLFDRFLIEENQIPLDKERPYIIQIARFDPSKGIPDVIESFRILREKLGDKIRPQLVLAGHGSVDDPDGIPILNYTHEIKNNDQYKDISDDIKVARLPNIDQILNALLREAHIALQLSHKEGYEIKVTEAIMKGVPIIVYNAGGMPLQVKDGKSGFIVEKGNTRAVAEKMYQLFTDNNLYKKMSENTGEHVHPETTTMSNAANWLFLANQLITRQKLEGNMKNVKELMKDRPL